jgi:hypothetical protein
VALVDLAAVDLAAVVQVVNGKTNL